MHTIILAKIEAQAAQHT